MKKKNIDSQTNENGSIKSSARSSEQGSDDIIDVANVRDNVFRQFPFSILAKSYINEADIFPLKKSDDGNTRLINGAVVGGKTTPEGANFHNFVVRNIAPFSEKFSDFILKHTRLLQSLDKARIEIDSTDPTVLAHEMLHQYFENSPLSGRNPDLSNNANAEKFGKLFLETWDKVSSLDSDSPLKGIDTRIAEDYDTENMQGADLATEKFAYLGELVGKYGLDVIPKELRPYYKQVFNFPKKK